MENINSEESEERIETKVKGFEFHGNPWEIKSNRRNEILKILVQESESSFTATEMANRTDCPFYTTQIILLELTLEGLVDLQMTRDGYSKLFRINKEKLAENIHDLKPKMTFDYRDDEEE